jgi:hypothetical protein
MPSILHVHELQRIQIYCSKDEQEICEKWKARVSRESNSKDDRVLEDGNMKH